MSDSTNTIFSVDALRALDAALDELEKTLPLSPDARAELRERAIDLAMANGSKWPDRYVSGLLTRVLTPPPGVTREQ